MAATAGDEQQQRTALLVASLHYCGETALSSHAAKDAGDLDVR